MKKLHFSTRERLEIVGMMPERALLRLRRAGIDLYDIQKPQKNVIRLTVKDMDVERVFAVYPKACYNTNGYTAYSVRSLKRMGVGKYLDFAKNRAGLLLGACMFCAGMTYADSMVFGVDFSASSVYAREAKAALEEYGITTFAKYPTGREDLVCSKLLSLSGMEFCSVKKSGMRVVVEMRLGDLPPVAPKKGDMQAAHEGILSSITALKGTPQKSVGEEVRIGETLVGAWLEIAEEERRETEVIARASIACAYTCVTEAEDAQEAFAIAYLQAGISDNDTVEERTVTPVEGGYAVTIAYTAVESMNF